MKRKFLEWPFDFNLTHYALRITQHEIAPRGFEPLNENQQAVDNKTLTENQNPVLSTGLDKILQKHPELAAVVEQWPNLPDAIKAEIEALISTHIKPEK